MNDPRLERVIHPAQVEPMVYLRRWNPEKKRVEYWHDIIVCWMKSYWDKEMFDDPKMFLSKRISYKDTWCEPFEGMEN